MFWLVSFQLHAQTFPQGFSRVQVATGISSPTGMAMAPDGRIFITQQGGAVRIVKNGVLLGTPFTTISTQSTGERGLIGITLDPNFATNQYVYLYYTLPDGSRNRIVRVTGNGDVAAAGTPVTVLNLDLLSSATNHNGGPMRFKNGLLYVCVGDNANGANAQNLDTYHGKILRINADGSVPAGNPYTTGSEQRRRVWSYGVRNPFNIDVNTSFNNDLWFNDVGENAWEEINRANGANQNYGWPQYEGVNTDESTASPFYAYAHGSGDGKGCAITGGTIYARASTNYPSAYNNQYYFMDLCNGWIGRIDAVAALPVVELFATGLGGQNLALTTGTDGNLYYLERGAGRLYRIIYTPPVVATPTITQQPQSQAVNSGATVAFNVNATGPAPITYQWQFNGVNIPGATGTVYTINNVQQSNAGNYRAVVTNPGGSVNSNTATLTVDANLREPDNASGAGLVPGLIYDYYEGAWSALPNFDTTVPVKSGTISTVDLTPRNRNDDFAFAFSGYLHVPDNGIYTFYLNSDDGSRLQIGATTVVVDNDGLHAAQERSGTIGLRAGYHFFVIYYFDHLGQQILTPSWSSANIPKQIIPASTYWRSGQQTTSWLYEAEDAYLSGPIVASNQPGYTGTGFADFQHASGDYIIWFGATPASAVYNLMFKYSLATAPVNMNLTINGSTINSQLYFPSTGSWSEWYGVLVTTVLNGGSNTIRLGVTGGGGPNIDHLEITPANSSLSVQEAVAEESSGRRMMAYPNPSTEGKLYVDWTAEHNAPVEIELVNFNGKVVKTAKFTDLQEGANTFTLDTEGLNNGVYWVKVKHGQERKAAAVVIKR